jgi:hypothetical protein
MDSTISLHWIHTLEAAAPARLIVAILSFQTGTSLTNQAE